MHSLALFSHAYSGWQLGQTQSLMGQGNRVQVYLTAYSGGPDDFMATPLSDLAQQVCAAVCCMRRPVKGLICELLLQCPLCS